MIRRYLIACLLLMGVGAAQENPCWEYWPGLDCDQQGQGCEGCHYLIRNCAGTPGCVWCSQACPMMLTAKDQHKYLVDLLAKARGNPSLLNPAGKRWQAEHKPLPASHPVIGQARKLTSGATCKIQAAIRTAR